MLFSSYKIRNKTIKNRIVMPQIVNFEICKSDGFVYDEHIAHYEKRAKENVGLIIVEATATNPKGRLANQLGAWDDKFIEGLSKIASSIKKHNCTPIIQIHDAGLKCDRKLNPAPYGPSIKEDVENSRELTKQEILKIKENFILAALRCEKAGFEGVEVHGAHGYLLLEFTHPKFNKRKDEYGGTLENRFRLSKEIVSGIRKRFNEDFIISYRMGAACPTLEDGKKGAKILEEAGVDVIHVSYSTREDLEIPTNNKDFNFSVISAKEIKEAVNIPVIAVNQISTPKRAQFLLENNYCDFVAIGQDLLSDYKWATKAKNGEKINYCVHCKPKCKYQNGYTRKDCPFYVD